MMKIDTSVAVSTRIRLARNFDGYAFSSIISGYEEEREIVSFVGKLFSKLGGYEVIHIKNLSFDEKNSLIERYLISNNLANNPFGAVCVSKNNEISVMINEEDHIREQCIVSGFDLQGALNKILPIDVLLNRNFRFAKDGEFYYTACPSNLGTGMRASVMLFLPALCYTDKIENVVNYARELGITFRGAFGEGSKAEGFWYQVSNSRTLGTTAEIITKVNQFVSSVIDDENDERYRLLEIYEHEIKDECQRAYGILNNCHLLSYEECMLLIAKVKFGNSIGVLSLKNPSALDDLLVTVRPATLKFISDNEDNEFISRANAVKSAFKII